MKYYVVSDIHGFYTPMVEALAEAGFFEDKEPHKLIVCGDMFDRGFEALKVQEFMLDLLHRAELIYIRGNHEDMFVRMLDYLQTCDMYHIYEINRFVTNGLMDTAAQLSEITERDCYRRPRKMVDKAKRTPYYTELIPASVDFFETEHYVFVHGWIPARQIGNEHRRYAYESDWRTVDELAWKRARWYNGMELAHDFKVTEQGKTIVCGHWHTSFGHSKYEGRGSEFEKDSDFSPYSEGGILAIDACTAYSQKVNCIVIEE